MSWWRGRRRLGTGREGRAWTHQGPCPSPGTSDIPPQSLLQADEEEGSFKRKKHYLITEYVNRCCFTFTVYPAVSIGLVSEALNPHALKTMIHVERIFQTSCRNFIFFCNHKMASILWFLKIKMETYLIFYSFSPMSRLIFILFLIVCGSGKRWCKWNRGERRTRALKNQVRRLSSDPEVPRLHSVKMLTANGAAWRGSASAHAFSFIFLL